MSGGLLWLRGLGLWPALRRSADRRPQPDLLVGVACPHCTNTDTLSRHCPDGRCGWARCTCGALVYSNRRHRHPRHRSGADTCHDPAAAV